MGSRTNGNALDTVKLTNMQRQSTDTTSQNTETTVTQLELFPLQSLNLICSLRDFHASLLAWLDGVEDLMTLEAHSFLKSHGFSVTKDPDIYYSKMLRAFLVLKVEKLSTRYLGFLPRLGIEYNGKYLIQKTSEYHRAESASSLSDILEENVDPKYFLSKIAQAKFLHPQEMQTPTDAQEGLPQ